MNNNHGSRFQQEQPWWIKAQQQQAIGTWSRGSWGWKNGRGNFQRKRQYQQRDVKQQNKHLDIQMFEGEEYEDKEYNEAHFYQEFGNDNSDNNNNSGEIFFKWKSWGKSRKEKLLLQYSDNVEFHKFVIELCKR